MIAESSPESSVANGSGHYAPLTGTEVEAGNSGANPSASGEAESTPAVDDEAEYARLAKLKPAEYDRERSKAAEKLGIRTSTLDAEVKRCREDAAAEKAISLCSDVEPFDDPVNVAELLADVRRTVLRFIVCEPSTATAAALWIGFTWCIEHVHVAPIALVTAPEKRCGKTQLLDLVGRLSRRPLFASNVSPAAVFRVIEASSPTLIVDEADSFFSDNEELRGVINSGHTRTTAFVIRCVGDELEPKRFSTWGAKAIAGIGKLADTIMDRSVALELRRKLPHEKTERLRHADPQLFETLARRLARFAQDHGREVGRARPHLPEALNDRAQDNWEPLLAVADIAGGPWPAEARRAALALDGAGEADLSIGEQLLAAIREVFEQNKSDKLSRETILSRLIDDEEQPWAELNKGKPLTAAQLRAKLAPYGIKTKKIRLNPYETAQGFERSQFTDMWARYLDGAAAPASSHLPENWNIGTPQEDSGSERPKTVPCSKPWNTDGDAENVQNVRDVPSHGSDWNAKGTLKAPETLDCSSVPNLHPPSKGTEAGHAWVEESL